MTNGVYTGCAVYPVAGQVLLLYQPIWYLNLFKSVVLWVKWCGLTGGLLLELWVLLYLQLSHGHRLGPEPWCMGTV